MPASKKSKTSPRSIKTQERIKEALEYRREGYSYDEIAEYMKEDHPEEKFYKQLIAMWVLKGMKQIIEEPAVENLKLDLERLDAMFRAAYANAINGDLQSISAAISILDRRSKIFGYDAVRNLGDESATTKPIKIQIVDKRRKDRKDPTRKMNEQDDVEPEV